MTFRFKCGDCQMVFDLVPAPPAEWGEPMPDDTEAGEPTCLERCPWCGAGEVRRVADSFQ